VVGFTWPQRLWREIVPNRLKERLQANKREKTGKPFEYHALSVKPFRIPLTEKCAIEKVKPLLRIISPLTPHKMAKKNSKNKLKIGKITLING